MPKLPSNKFLADESVEYRIVLFLRDSDFDVVSISIVNTHFTSMSSTSKMRVELGGMAPTA